MEEGSGDLNEISKERAEAIDAAWNAASDTQRLGMPRMSWIGADAVTYYEEQPSKLELKAAARIAELEAALTALMRKSADHIIAGHPINADALAALREAERVLTKAT